MFRNQLSSSIGRLTKSPQTARVMSVATPSAGLRTKNALGVLISSIIVSYFGDAL